MSLLTNIGFWVILVAVCWGALYSLRKVFHLFLGWIKNKRVRKWFLICEVHFDNSKPMWANKSFTTTDRRGIDIEQAKTSIVRDIQLMDNVDSSEGILIEIKNIIEIT